MSFSVCARQSRKRLRAVLEQRAVRAAKLPMLLDWIRFTFRQSTRAQPLLVHVLMLALVIVYSLLGAVVFQWTEGSNQSLDNKNGCRPEPDPCCLVRPEWSFNQAFLFSFTVISTIGYGNIAPSTFAGRSFCIIYGLIGIPLAMLAIADLGKFILQMAIDSAKRVRTKYRLLLARHPLAQDWEVGGGALGGLLLLAFSFYVLFGALLLPLYERHMTFLSAIYFNFVTMTTIGLGDIVPHRERYLVFTLVYITVGLSLTTIAIELASECLKKLHYYGRKLTNLGNISVWFGGDSLTMNQIVKNLGEQFDVSDEVIDQLNIDDFVHTAIEVEAGRMPSIREQRGGYGQVLAEMDSNWSISKCADLLKDAHTESVSTVFGSLVASMESLPILTADEQNLSPLTMPEQLWNSAECYPPPDCGSPPRQVTTPTLALATARRSPQTIKPGFLDSSWKSPMEDQSGNIQLRYDPKKRIKMYQEEWNRREQNKAAARHSKSKLGPVESVKQQFPHRSHSSEI